MGFFAKGSFKSLPREPLTPIEQRQEVSTAFRVGFLCGMAVVLFASLILYHLGEG